jgi:hypothetical protein
LRLFTKEELQLVKAATQKAEHFVRRYYVLAPREWNHIHYEVKTQTELEPTEMLDSVLAQVVCYQYVRKINEKPQHKDLYCICLQDRKIIHTFNKTSVDLFHLLLYVLTHELVHVVRFGQQLQRIDLPLTERAREEEFVETITQRILHSHNYLPNKIILS